MKDKSAFNQRNQRVFGPQINIGGDAIIQTASRLPIPNQIPPPPQDFTGRDEDILELLDNFDRGATIIGMRGLGGIGKTTLALVLANKLKDRAPDGQLFLDLRGTSYRPMKSIEAMDQVIRAYFPTAHMPDDQNEIRGVYLSILSGKRVLLLLDNAASREQVEPLRSPEGCIMLITSRQRFVLPGMKAKDLDILLPADACHLLLAIAERIGDHAEELAELCGYLPLALRNVASVLEERVDLAVIEYIQQLKEARKLLDLVAASFSLSYDMLLPDKQELWCKLSVFPDDFDRAGAAAVWKMDLDQAAEVLGELVKWSLVNFVPSAASAKGRYRLHDLARRYANSRMDFGACSAAEQQHAEYYRDIFSAATRLYLQGGNNIMRGLVLFDTEWGNIQAGQAWAEKNCETNDRAAALCGDYADWPFLLELRLHPIERIRWFETALISAQRLEDRGKEAAHLGNLGITYAVLGETRKAIDYYKQALTIDREIGDRRGEGADLGNLGLAYADLGEARKAIEFYEQYLAIAREIGDRRDEGNALGNLGLAYSTLGEARKTIEFCEKYLAIAREIGDKRGEANALGNLGLAYSALGEIGDAIEHYEQALAIDREIGDRMGEANALANLGLACRMLGEIRKAIEYYEQALVIEREIGNRRGEGDALFNMSLSFEGMRKMKKAIDSAEAALGIYEKIESPYADIVRQKLIEWKRRE